MRRRQRECPPHDPRTTTEEAHIGPEIVTYEKTMCARCGTLLRNNVIHRRKA